MLLLVPESMKARYAIFELVRAITSIAALPPKCQTAFVMRKVHGFSQREIAARMGVSEGTVEKHISRGIAQLMATFARGGKGAPAASIEENLEDRYDLARNQRGH